MDGTQKHPLNKTMVLAAAVLSGKHWRIKDFQRTLDSSYFHPGGTQLANNMTLSGKILSFGVINGINVQMKLLRRN